MKVRISIEQEFDVDMDYGYDLDLGYTEGVSNDTKIDYFVNRFAEDIDYMVKYDETRDHILVEYIEE